MAMDSESDDSERWEDFFGSTTDLTPSLIGLYDTLTGNHKLDSNSLPTSTIQKQLQQQSQPQSNQSNKSCVQNTKSANDFISSESTRTATTTTTTTTTHVNSIENKSVSAINYAKIESFCHTQKIDCSDTPPLEANATHHSSTQLRGNNSFVHSQKQYRSFRVLSPNVQRIISHSNTVVETDAITSSKRDSDSDRERTKSPVSPDHVRLTKRLLGKAKTSCIPLSRNICKLSQAGSNLDSKSFSPPLNSPTERNAEVESTPLDSVRNLINTFEFNAADTEKTPTNLNCNNFDFESQIAPKLFNDDDESFANLENKELIVSTKKPKQTVKFLVEPLNIARATVTPKGSAGNQRIKNVTLNGEMESTTPLPYTENEKKNLKISKSPLQLRRSIRPNSPILTYARVKMLANKSSVQKLENSSDLNEPHLVANGNNGTHPPSSNGKLQEKNGVIKSSPTKQQQHLRKINSLITDVANLKCRPLSSSSICSTSSSTSSSTTGSSSANENHSNGKSEVTSYLASVESLADHSEGESHSLSSSSNNTLSVLERICLEIIESERSYVEDLRQVIQGYLLDWKRRQCLNANQIKILFSNIEDIYEFNRELLGSLMNSGMNPVIISKCFIDLNCSFNVYSAYCTNYHEAISLLTTLLQNPQTNALLRSTQEHLGHTLPLGSYLLKPVQRILKYHLLLDNVRKYCDHPETSKAYEIMREVARKIDQVKKKLEQQNRVKELSGILDGWLGPDLSVLGELRLEGLLMESGKPRRIFLFETMLIITKPKEDNRLQFKSYIYRNNLMLTEHLPGEPTSFNVIPYDEPRNLTKLTAKTREQKKQWAQNIKSVIIELLDIPTRAKELVFKLGDEEDRTPDKNIRKWGLNTSTPTPVYLERRNQYRRSEIRNRSKVKRKTVTNSSSFDALNNAKAKLLERKRSIDDNLMTSLSIQKLNLTDDPKLAGSANECNNNNTDSNSYNKDSNDSHSCNNTDAVDCNDSVNDERQSKLIYTKDKKHVVPRSSSASRAESDDENNGDCKHSKQNKKVEVKMYNTKTIPKRIATLKKTRANKKETATFYMDISEFNDTVLKITESSENLSDISKNTIENAEFDSHLKSDDALENPENESLVPAPQLDKRNDTPSNLEEGKTSKKEKDAEIIEALLKQSKDFEKILNKSPRKKSLDNGRPLIGTEPRKSILTPPPPPPPRSSPPPLEADRTKRQISDPGPIEEPIYETLLRNVHVPYKFSPILNRSKSQQYHRPNKIKSQLTQRPESDYVTLVYDKSASLENTSVSQAKFGDVLRNSDSSINYHTAAKNDSNRGSDDHCNIPTKTESISSENKNQKTLVQRFRPTAESSFLPRMIKSVDNISQYRKKQPERRVSDVTEMCRRQSIIHKQGGEAVGERMAHQDYADPKTLFQSVSTNSSAVSLNNYHQRDSVYSLTSSSDSVSTGIKKSPQKKQQSCTSNMHQDEYSTQFNYEDCVETCLENDFRDSAIYSDDNERRQDNIFELAETKIKNPSPWNFNNGSKKSNKINYKDNDYQLSSPPPKPTALPKRMTLSKSISNPSNLSNNLQNSIEPDKRCDKSWVLKQIANFNK